MTGSRNKWWRVLAVLIALTLVAAACGDDDDSDTGEETTTGEETAGEETTGEDTAGEDTADEAASGDAMVAEVFIATTEGNQRRETTQDAMKAQLEEAGFKMSPDNSDAATLFGERGPASDFDVSLWATVGTQTPEYSALFCTKNIPGPENNNAGQNWTQTSVAELDEVLEAAETELDEDTRIELYAEAQEIMAEEVVSIPIDPLPEIAIHDTSVVSGPIGPNPVYSLYWNLNEWELVDPSAESLVVAGEQEPECADFIASCAGASWGVWSIGVHTLPRAYDQIDGDYVPSPLLAGEPELDTSSGQVVTYDINPDAVWSDGTPITSVDFEYTWSQIATGDDIYDTTGYANMVSVDSSDPSKAVVTFDPPFAQWKDMFGGFYGVLPKHILCGEDTAVADCSGEDRNAAMNDGFEWSGGPWIATWNKGSDVTLTPNENYWGTQPTIPQVVIQFIEDTSAQIQALKAKEVSAANPQPQLELGAQLGDDPDLQVDVNVKTTFLEALWINMAESPWDDIAVRQALAYSIDRDAVVGALFGDFGVDVASQSLIQPAAELYVTDAFASYTRDLEKVDELMTGAGWEKNGDGFWEKSA